MKSGFYFVLIAAFNALLFSSCIKSDPDPTIAIQERWKSDTTTIGKYLIANNISAMTHASGVRFVIDSLAVGFPPAYSGTVKFKYVGRLLNGTIFDSGTTSGVLTNFIPGFQVGLTLMTEGSKARIYIPSGLAYGTAGTTGIPPNSVIMFELQLTEVVRTATEKQKLATDTVAIDQYLADNSINAVRDKSGLRYVITDLGTGAQPDLYTKVKVSYSGKLLSDGTDLPTVTVEPNSDFDSYVISYLYAFQVILPKLPVGSKVTLYVPSGLAFGATAVTSGATIPANSNLIYNLELLGIVN